MRTPTIGLFLLLPLWCAGKNDGADIQLPVGATIPMVLDHGIDARRAKPGDLVTARTTQPIPLDRRHSIPARAKVNGRIIEAEPPSANDPAAALVLRFDQLAFSRYKIPIRGHVRAVASFVAVSDAKVPEASPGFGDSEANWTTRQIGGDIAYHQGPIVSHGRELGTETLYGTLIDPGFSGLQSQIPLAFGEFSALAQGVYGFTDLKLSRADTAANSLKLSSAHSDIKLNSGTEMLLVLEP